jgi:DNA-binding protein H-NS
MTMPSPVLKEQTTTRPNGHTQTPGRSLPADAAPGPPFGLPDLAALPDDALAGLVAQGQEEIAQRQARREGEFLSMVAATAKTLGLTPARVAAAIANKSLRPRATGGTDGRSSVRPKFWCVTDHALRWSGRGGAPKWFSDHISSGGKEEDMRIPDGVQ